MHSKADLFQEMTEKKKKIKMMILISFKKKGRDFEIILWSVKNFFEHPLQQVAVLTVTTAILYACTS